ncbi:hypothetical protein BDQ12DRAFT_630131 [Crucibulum laeve]|uniref:MYND-type domain-containing protein n=1 Tax=Crucibulum laeve TaxID=68775 RepID=A0A5C3M0V0_9AGAR|nr:hypothetical protein BDQ12DRAFT_630131 [Crucibulum laeve]
MRESNFAFPAQNKACVCITSQLYDRRALDTTSPLPLFNSLTHLTYLTSTSPRIREIMTMDGGLERLVRILHDFCLSPPPPDNPAVLYGLLPPNARPPKPTPTLNPPTFDKHAAYRFSLAFQCVVNIGVRGSEPIRSRVVQAGTLDVVGCVLEAWLAGRGFAIGPSASATGMPRETREQRQARRQAAAQARQREDAALLSNALQQELATGRRNRIVEHEQMDVSTPPPDSSQSSSHASTPHSTSDTDTSTFATPLGSGTPTGAVVVPASAIRDRSGTIIARPVWDQPPAPHVHHHPRASGSTATLQQSRSRRNRPSTSPSPSPIASANTSRPDTETEDDGDGDVEMDVEGDTSLDTTLDNSRMEDDSDSANPSPRRIPHPHMALGRRAVGIVSDDPAAENLDGDAHIIINEEGGVNVGGVEVGVGGVEDGIVSLGPNDDFAMGAPPGAPGALNMDPGRGLGLTINVGDQVTVTGRRRGERGEAPPDATPRAGVIGLPPMISPTTTIRPPAQVQAQGAHQRTNTIRARPTAANVVVTEPVIVPIAAAHHERRHREHRDEIATGPYRDEDVLLSLQLLAYLSKYPHVRQAFYKTRVSFHPASAGLTSAMRGRREGKERERDPKEKDTGKEKEKEADKPNFFRALASRAGKEKEKCNSDITEKEPITSASTASSTSMPQRQTNVFSLVERFTFKPSSSETELPNPPPRLPPEIQYWAGVIMRNACRKDESRGGIRQCANMLCGKWESYPREFAKCRRCRKAKYCGKECQSTAWSEGHRFWCSAKDQDDDLTGDHTQHHHHHQQQQQQQQQHDGEGVQIAAVEGEEHAIPVRRVRDPTRARDRIERERDAREEADTATVRGGFRPPPSGAVPGTVRTDRERPTQSTVRRHDLHLRPRDQPMQDVSMQGMRRRAETIGATTTGSRTQPAPRQRPQVPSFESNPGPSPPGEAGPSASGSWRRRGEEFRPPASGDGDDMMLG